MRKRKQQTVDSWTDATIGTYDTAKDKFFEFPRQGLVLAQPAIVRKKPNGKTVVAASFRPAASRGTAIIASHSVLRKLNCRAGDAIEYKTASFLNVVWATKVAVLIALLGCGVVIGSVVIAIAALFPGEQFFIHVGEIVGGLTIIVAVGIAVISIVKAYKDPSG